MFRSIDGGTILGKWDLRFFNLAQHIAQWSKDPSSKVGAVLARDNRFISAGFNGFPRFTRDDPELYELRERKYRRVLHAERNALSFSKGDSEGTTMYVTFAPCSSCTAQMIQDGVRRVVCPDPRRDLEYLARWRDDIKESVELFTEAGIQLDYF